MNDKIQLVLKKIDEAAEKLEFLPKITDRVLAFLKKPVIAGFPPLVNKITSKFGGAIAAVFSIIFAINCLKNALVSCFFENAPAGMMFGYAVAALIFIVVNCFLIHKMDGVFDKIIKTSPSRISSKNIFVIASFLSVLVALVSLIGGIYLAIDCKSFNLFIYGVVGAVFFVLLAIYNSAPEDFAVAEDENASAGEDFIAVSTFSIKLILRLIPILVFVLSIVGICQCVPEIFEAYTKSHGKGTYLNVPLMMETTSALGIFLFVGFIPLLAYFYYLISYVTLGLIRATLSIPRKLDEIIRK